MWEPSTQDINWIARTSRWTNILVVALPSLSGVPRVETHSNPVTDECCEAYGRHEVDGVLIVARGDASEVLEASEHALDDVAMAVTLSIEGVGLVPVGPVGDDRLDASALQPSPPMIRVVCLVGEKVTGVGQAPGEHDGAGDVGGLAGGEIERQGTAMGVAYGMDLGVAPALGAADGLNRSPPFPPPAQRCALTWVVSMETSSGVPASAAVSSANMYCQMPFCDQRL